MTFEACDVTNHVVFGKKKKKEKRRKRKKKHLNFIEICVRVLLLLLLHLERLTRIMRVDSFQQDPKALSM